MRYQTPFLLALVVCAVFPGCRSMSIYHEDAFYPLQSFRPGRMLGHAITRSGNVVNISLAWRLEGEVLDVEWDVGEIQVLRAAAQHGAMLTSLELPGQTRVETSATADSIYYNAYTRRFSLVGNPVVRQGDTVTHDARTLTMLEDGSIVSGLSDSDVDSDVDAVIEGVNPVK